MRTNPARISVSVLEKRPCLGRETETQIHSSCFLLGRSDFFEQSRPPACLFIRCSALPAHFFGSPRSPRRYAAAASTPGSWAAASAVQSIPRGLWLIEPYQRLQGNA